MHRIVGAAVAAALSITSIFASPGLASTPPPGGHEWQVQAGSPPRFDAAGPSGAGNRFYPEAITIHQGDHITFTPAGPHTVTFNRPPGPIFRFLDPSFPATPSPATITSASDSVMGIIGFGPPGPPEHYVVSFTSPGTYQIICGLHLGMTLSVDVRPTGATLPKEDAQYLAIAQAAITRDLATVDRIAAAATDNFEDEDGNPTVLVGAGDKRVSNIRFFPASVTIRVGRSINFLKTQDPTEPHTVTFGNAFDPNDPLAEFRASGGSRYNGTGVANSGFLSTSQQFSFYQLAGTGLPVAVTRYRLTFTSVGDFPYICAIHDPAGMVGIVHVVR